MKKLFTLSILFITVKILAQPCSFTINPLGGPYSITCSNPIVNLQALTNYTGGVMSYTWLSSGNPPLNGNSQALTNPGIYTVTASDMGCTATSQTFAVVMNTMAPTNSVNPVSQVINCNGSPVTFSGTVLNPTANIQHDWYSPLNPLPGGVPIATSNNTISILSGMIPPGVYTLVTTNLINGCKAQKTITVTSLDAWPTFGVFTTTNFSVGCSPLNQTTLCITNPASTQTPAATCSYTFLPPTFAGTLAPGPYGASTCAITTMPGTWTLIVNDNSNNCKTMLSVPVTQNTIAPHVLATMFTSTLTCYNPTVLASGTSTSPNTVVNWYQPIAPQLVPISTIIVGPGSGPSTSTTSLTYASYTVIATNTLNACVSASVVMIRQNFKPPVSSPNISIGSPTAICGENAVVLTTGQSTTTSGGPFAFAIPELWEGPAPQATLSGASSYNCMVPGNYSLTIKDSYNGCTKTGTINVLNLNPVFTLQGTAPTSSVSCNGSVVITPSAQPGYSISVSMGTLTGNNVTNLCFGQLIVCLSYTSSGCKKCDSLIMNATTSIKTINSENEFILYPNPANSIFFIKSTQQKSGTIKIFNVEGKEIENLILENNKETKIENLFSGIYFVEIRIEGSVYRKKVVVINY